MRAKGFSGWEAPGLKRGSYMGIFSLDNVFGKFMDKVWKWIILNFLCMLCCIPLITVGPAITALFSVLMQMTRGEEDAIIKSYFRAFKRNFKQAVIIHMLLLVIAVVILLNVYYGKQLQREYEFYKYWQYLMYVIAFVYLMVLTYVYPLVATFENTVWGTVKNALLLPITHIGWTCLMLTIGVVPLYLCYVNADIMKWGIFFYGFCGIALVAYIYCLIFKRIFAQYLNKNCK